MDKLTKRTIQWIIVILLALVIWVSGTIWMCRVLFPAEDIKAFHHPPLTTKDKAMLKAAVKEHGDYRITREGKEGIFIMHRLGGRIRL